MKLVQKSLTPWIAALCGAFAALAPLAVAEESAPYLAYYSPSKGFKTAQTELAKIFLQLAGSLEYSGSPESYLRHMQAEHRRIAKLYEAKTGRALEGHWPSYMTDEYMDNFIYNWKLLSPKLRLDGLTKDAGMCTREAIRGTHDKGTILIGILSHHQKLVVAAMKSGQSDVGFEELRDSLAMELGMGKPQSAQDLAALVKWEKALSDDERQEYASLLRHEHFTREEFGQLDHFYKRGYDKLTEEGKNEMSRRIWAGMQKGGPEDIRSDAIASAAAFQGQLTNLFKALDSSVAAEKSRELKAMVKGGLIELGELAQAELELGVLDFALH